MNTSALPSLALRIFGLLLTGIIALTACGATRTTTHTTGTAPNSTPTVGRVIATVGATPITTTAVNHWMGTFEGADYYEMSGSHTAPDGLVSDPPNLPACVAHLEAAATSSPKRTSYSSVTLLAKCQRLNGALREQATEFLIKTQWVIDLDASLGITTTDQEVQNFYNQLATGQFPNPIAAEQYLQRRRTSKADQLVIARLDLLQQKVQQRLSAEGKAFQGQLDKAAATWTSNTNCTPGYVVEHCKQYSPNPTPATPSPAVLTEQVVALATGRCINTPACSKQ